jgi:hypothetical protein
MSNYLNEFTQSETTKFKYGSFFFCLWEVAFAAFLISLRLIRDYIFKSRIKCCRRVFKCNQAACKYISFKISKLLHSKLKKNTIAFERNFSSILTFNFSRQKNICFAQNQIFTLQTIWKQQISIILHFKSYSFITKNRLR